MKNGWISGAIEPERDGYYIAQCGYGDDLREVALSFTVSGGWGTYGHEPEDERGNDDYINNDEWIAAWYNAPEFKREDIIA